jgi:outer membrane protein assembly factor BamA
VAAQAEWLTPWPKRWEERARAGFFYDVGNVFSTGDTVFADDAGAPLDYGFDAAELRQSVGLVAHFRIPLGVISVSYACRSTRRGKPAVFASTMSSDSSSRWAWIFDPDFADSHSGERFAGLRWR